MGGLQGVPGVGPGGARLKDGRHMTRLHLGGPVGDHNARWHDIPCHACCQSDIIQAPP